MTGALVNSSDAVTTGLADWLLLEEQYPTLLKELQKVPWGTSGAKELVSALLALLEEQIIDSKPTTQICLISSKSKKLAKA